MKRLLSIFLLLSAFNSGFAQTMPDIQQNYNGLSFTSFADTLASAYGIRVFHKPEWVSSVTIVQNKVPESLTEIMSKTLENSDVIYYVYDNRLIILSKNSAISPTVSPDYLEAISRKQKQEVVFEVPVEEHIEHENGNEEEVVYIGKAADRNQGKTATISGYVKNKVNGEPIVGAMIYVEDLKTGVVTNSTGYYALTIAKGKHQITFHSLGSYDRSFQVVLNGDGPMHVELEDQITQLKGAVIIADKYQNVSGMQMGMDKLEIKSIKEIPMAMGEVDIIKAAILLPGVQTVGEAASGFNVRGGNTDQNLIMLNDAPVFNTSHLFGFFSAFNADIVKDFKLYKSGIPANYGGRISSVFDIRTKNGNDKKIAGSGGISPVTARLSVEVPIVKEKASLMVSARSTFSDYLFQLIKNTEFENSSASFYDLFGSLNVELNENNLFNMSAYTSHDYFQLNSDTVYTYDNLCMNANWKHLFSNKFYGNLKYSKSSYFYNVYSEDNLPDDFELKYKIDYDAAKGELTNILSNNHSISYGFEAILYRLNPGSLGPRGDSSLVMNSSLEKEKALETALFFTDNYDFGPRLSLMTGLRYSAFNMLGPQEVYTYQDGYPKEAAYINDTLHFTQGDQVAFYHHLEPRLSLRYKFAGNNSVKIGYNLLTQYLHMLTNTTAVSPTDTWKLSDTHIKPQICNQISVGFYHDFPKFLGEASVEVYYKDLQNIIEYEGGAKLLMNPLIEADLLNVKGKAYGIEVLLKKKQGKINGWISYTWSRIELITTDTREELINKGLYYPANFDKPHDVTLVANYRFTRRFSVSTNLTYSTGRPITYPVSRYNVQGITLLHYSERNEYRIPDYFRWDIALNLDGNLKSKKIASGYWSLSVYNLTGRQNAYSIYFISDKKYVRGYKLSVFGRPIPTLSYTFTF